MLFGWNIIAASIAINIALSIPTIDYPLNSQVPRIARVSEPFSYTFPKSTFSSSLPISYQLTGPKWLSLDNETRTLSGTPSEKDVGTDTLTEVVIGLTASDSSGPVTLSATLIVSKNPALAVNIPLSSQLPSFGTFSVPSTLSYHLTTPFKFSFDPNTFSSDGKGNTLKYYAATDDHTPILSWVKFDGSTLTFSGQSPDYASLIQPPQTFGIMLIASDVDGFAGNSMVFDLTVGPHQLSFSNTSMVLNATGGNTVDFAGLADNLQLDGQTANSTSIKSITTDTPSWLEFDNSTMKISGTAPPHVVPKNLTVHAEDIYGDSANATILLQVEDSIISKEIPELNATIDSDFKYDLNIYLSDPSDVTVDLKTDPSQTWIHLDTKVELAGHVPEDTKPGDIDISITATSKVSGASETQTFKFVVAAQLDSSGTSTKIPGASPTTNLSQTASETAFGGSTNRKLSRGAILAMAITIPLVVLLALLACLLCYCKRRRDAKKRPASITKSDISAPIESHSSVEEIVLPPPVAAPPPLELDTCTSLDNNSIHGLTTNEKHESWRYFPRKSSPPQDRRMRRSQTISGDGVDRRLQVMSGAISITDDPPGEVKSSVNRVRSYSENALTKTENSSWRSTQESASHQTLRSSRTNSSQLLGRTYSNYSRKGHKRRSAHILEPVVIGDREESNPNVAVLAHSSPPPTPPPQPRTLQYLDTPSQPPQTTQYLDFVKRESSILGLSGSDISASPLDSFSALGKKPISPEPEIIYVPEGTNNSQVTSRTTRRQSRMFPGFEGRRRTAHGHGHGVHRSISSISSKSNKRRSSGHGQVWTTNTNLNHNLGHNPSLARNSKTWKTVATSSNQTERPPSTSNVSALSEYSSTYSASPPFRSAMHMGIRQVTGSPEVQDVARLGSKSSSRNSRPVSRRIGSSPFFGGGSMRSNNRDSRYAPPRNRTSYADSPTVPEELPEEPPSSHPSNTPCTTRSLRSPETPLGSPTAWPGNQRANPRFYIQDQDFGTRDSAKSLESRDSRFESAIEFSRSPTMDLTSPSLGQHKQKEDSYEDFLPDDYSDGSWETQADIRVDLANVTLHGDPSSELGGPEAETELTARMGWSGRANVVPGESSRSRTAEKSRSFAPEGGRGRDVGGGPGPRILKGARRPVSVGAVKSGLKGSVRGRIEGDKSEGEGEWGAFI
ncbi:hypothetical protein HYALB_00003891 [Hymenoscyphus albidus]|uniref:Dystroglycan-type cadherin-like domain-containing protein n=1 Tax=Hymenoscyphus albidus TaxID=595503 RepID=A0A9N9LV35_9HELO|nr:hypothetical protein HYALB_00003891 [Hymenoscyphus albidus]